VVSQRCLLLSLFLKDAPYHTRASVAQTHVM
jgi:hypothetical protein